MRLSFDVAPAQLVARLGASLRERVQRRLDEAWVRGPGGANAARVSDDADLMMRLDPAEISRRISSPYRS